MITILNGDVLQHLKELPDCSVHCCVTSPPYWGLRDYGVDGQIGLEKTPEEYVAKMVEVFQEVKRVLRDDGTLWLNLGDSYGSGGRKTQVPQTVANGNDQDLPLNNRGKQGFEKQLIGIPWRVAFALQADGWYLRSDIIWSKPNPMPESVTDRPTKAHEYVFLLAKNARYYYDADAVREAHVTQENRPDGIIRNRLFEYDSKENQLRPRKPNKQDQTGNPTYTGFNERWRVKNLQRQDPNTMHQAREMARNGTNIPGHSGNYNANGECLLNPNGRNRRTVWEIATQPTPDAHFATFPEALVEPCIKAGCPLGGVVLDPFGGSGTTGLVARNLKRDCILIELNPAYVKIMKKKLRLNEQLDV